MRTDEERRRRLGQALAECGLGGNGRDVESEALALGVLRAEQEAAAREGRAVSEQVRAAVLGGEERKTVDPTTMIERRMAEPEDDPTPGYDPELDLPPRPKSPEPGDDEWDDEPDAA